MKSYKVFYQFFKLIKSVEVSAKNCNDAKTEAEQRHGVDKRYILRVEIVK